jgi:tetratricopeptide (TPR) repeat protein
MKQRPARWRVATTAVTLFAQLAVTLTPAIGVAQTPTPTTTGTPRPAVQRGQEYYEQSRFDEAITLLRDLVDRGQLAGDDLQKARELLARSYVKKGYPAQAKEMFKAILRTVPDWRPDPIKVPPDETAVFDQSLKEFQAEGGAPPATTPPPTTPTPEKIEATPPSGGGGKQETVKPVQVVEPSAGGGKKSKKMLWYGLGGAALVGVIAVAAGGGSKSSTPAPTPAPPSLPGFPSTP